MIFRHTGTVVVMLLAVAASPGLTQTPTAAVAVPEQAQTQPLTRTPLQRFDVPGTDYETLIVAIEVQPNVGTGRHSHPGIESGYVLDGKMTLIVDGRPEETLKAGDSYQIPAGAIHDGKSGPHGAKVIATFVVEKHQPFATPAE